jgi:hypothetical protein
MKRCVLFCFALCIASALYSQSNFSVYFGQSQTTFKYENSEGTNDLDFRTQLRSNYGINFSKVFGSGLFIRPGVGFTNLGASSDLYGQKLNWALKYIDLNLGVGYIQR